MGLGRFLAAVAAGAVAVVAAPVVLPAAAAGGAARAAARYRCRDIGGSVIGALGSGYFAPAWCRQT